MHKVMFAVEVYVKGGLVFVQQESNDGSGEDAFIQLTPEQVDVVVSWMREAAREALKDGEA